MIWQGARTLVRSHGVAVCLAVLVIVLRVVLWAQGRSLWLDEQMVAGNIRSRGFGGLAGLLDNDQAAPLGWLWVERAMYLAFGSGERPLRFQALVAGVGTVIVAVWIGYRWLSPLAATVLVGLCGFNFALVGYSAQLKHYSSDAFFTLLLMGLTLWAADNVKRQLVWWAVAVLASWLSLGATLAIPGLALILLGLVWRRHGVGALIKAAVPGVVWVGSFAVHYFVALRPNTTSNSYLADFWAAGFPPHGAGPVGLLKWVGKVVKALSANPLYLNVDSLPYVVSVAVGLIFWALVASGLIVGLRHKPMLGLVALAPPVSAFLLALLRLAPMTSRLVLWILPALFLAVALAVDAGYRTAAIRWVAVASVVVLVLPLAFGVRAVFRPDVTDDRAAIRYLQEHHQPGDLVLYVSSAGRAAEWYDPQHVLTPALAVLSGPGCTVGGLERAAKGYRRILAYAGVRYNPYTETYQQLGAELARAGTVRDTVHFNAEGIVWVVDLDKTDSQPVECLTVY